MNKGDIMTDVKVTAINPKYQKTVNRFLNWNQRHDEVVNDNFLNDREGSPLQERTYKKAYIYFHDLPKRERVNICKTVKTISESHY